MKTLFLLLLLALSVSPTPTYATDYYVSASAGSNTNDGKSTAKPFLTIQRAADLTIPGDTVFVMNGVYSSTSGPVLNITRSGSATAWITFKALKGHSPKITGSGNVWNTVSINGWYILFDGFELIGNNANLTYAGALTMYNDAKAGGTNWSAYANYNTNGISIGGPRDETKFPHHVTVRNCKVHDFPGGGISSIQADYTTIENNLVYNNAWYMMYAGSGISILTPFNHDKLTTYKNIVRNNVCHTNKTTIPWLSLGRLSDGNGIIIDVNRHGYSEQDATTPSANAYTGRTLVENNLSVNNGGSGIHAFKADHVDIINNTAYNNGTVVGYAEIFANTCDDVSILNNIMYGRDGGDCNSTNKNTNVRYDYNVYVNGKVAVKGPSDIVADPQFVNRTLDLATGDFTLKATSPAVDKGTNVPGQFSRADLLGVSRPQGSKPDIGAYEYREQASVITAIAEPAEVVQVTPNPVDNVLTVNWTNVPGMIGRAELVNSLGQLMMQAPLTGSSTQLTLQKLPSGLYLLRIYRNDKLLNSSKVLKQ
ncbi:choice-of-anchor Q domain-containing protein [Fibrella sp. WM1]|uniref:choice-of-anchor Q domain-containing protein n=1 Tax=Fibrella musci TaxID=3242485 RepID=UPI00351FA902